MAESVPSERPGQTVESGQPGEPDQPGQLGQAGQLRVRDRDVVLAAALVVAGVLIAAWLTGLVPALDDAIGLAPIVIVGLIVVTLVVLARALLPPSPTMKPGHRRGGR